MGAWSSNRKRGDGYFKTHLSPIPFDQSHGRSSKRSKFSVCANPSTPQSQTNRASSSSPNSTVSLVAQYPDSTKRFPREVHAPVRNSRFESSASAKKTETTADCRGNLVDKMGASNPFALYRSCRDAALRSLRYVFRGKQEEKEVIELDENKGCDDISNNSSLEKLEIMGRWEGKGTMGDLQEPSSRTAEKEVRSSVVADISNAITENGDMEKAGLSLLLEMDDDPGVPSYLRLYNRSKKRDDKLAYLKYNIELGEKDRQELQSSRHPKIESIKKDVTEECFVPLTDEEKKKIYLAFSNSKRREVLIAHMNSCIDITGEKLQCLKPGAWLNDEVINLYFELLKEREKREPQKFLKCHFFNTFFYKKLIGGRDGYNFQSVRRWTSQKKLGYSLLECDKIFVPIHKDIHWCLAVINKKDEKFQYLDSLGGSDNQVLDVLAKYFADEVKDKCGKDINVNSWEKEFVAELPEQLNGFDCGVFMIKYADFYSRGIGLCFSQDHMPYFRLRTAKEILKLRAD